jgi:arsenate reductase-like glutaredoxin family protein
MRQGITGENKPFLNSRHELDRSGNIAKQVPSRQDAIRLMPKKANSIKRPVLVRGDRMVPGF